MKKRLECHRPGGHIATKVLAGSGGARVIWSRTPSALAASLPVVNLSFGPDAGFAGKDAKRRRGFRGKTVVWFFSNEYHSGGDDRHFTDGGSVIYSSKFRR
jgi:hypothetical protein